MDRRTCILRIEKISIRDGSGMRSVVFFKGCPLRCAWCSTPESHRMEPEIGYQASKCMHCGRCIKKCPNKALSFDGDGNVVRDREVCTECMHCTKCCPTHAMKCYGSFMSVDEVMKIILRDTVFYYHSGGGVTLSGGDVLLHADFAEELLSECKESALNTTIETELFGDFDKIEKLIPLLDTWHVDVKAMDDAVHKKWTGTSNRGILSNLKKLDSLVQGKVIYIRVPLVPGINTDAENILGIYELVKGMRSVLQLEFLPYHILGRDTYGYLGKEYSLPEIDSMTREDVRTILDGLALPEIGAPVFIDGELYSE